MNTDPSDMNIDPNAELGAISGNNLGTANPSPTVTAPGMAQSSGRFAGSCENKQGNNSFGLLLLLIFASISSLYRRISK
jgi:hypothetical protein